MEIEELIDQQLPSPHGNRQGLSYGQLALLLITYMISQGDHRLCAVEPWVVLHHHILEWATGWKIGLKDATDDRLGNLLKLLGCEKHQAIETIFTQLGQHLIRTYEWEHPKKAISIYTQSRPDKKRGTTMADIAID